MYFKVEPTGCEVRNGRVKIIFSFYLDPDDYKYDEKYVQVKDMTPEDEVKHAQYSEDRNIWLSQFPVIFHIVNLDTLEQLTVTKEFSYDITNEELQIHVSESIKEIKESFPELWLGVFVGRDIGDEVFPKQQEWDNWYDTIPMKWQNNPFHNHKVYIESEWTDKDILYIGEVALLESKRKWDNDIDLGKSKTTIKNQPIKQIENPTVERLAVCEVKLADIQSKTLEKMKVVDIWA